VTSWFFHQIKAWSIFCKADRAKAFDHTIAGELTRWRCGKAKKERPA
jgi:hypothetical protein